MHVQRLCTIIIDLIIDTYFVGFRLVSKDTVSNQVPNRIKRRNIHQNSAALGLTAELSPVFFKFYASAMNPAHVHGKITYCVYHLHIFNHTLAETIKFIGSTQEDGQKVSCSAEDNCFLQINIYFISHWYGLHGNCRRNRSQCLIPWRWCSIGEWEILNNYCLCHVSLLGTHGGGAQKKKRKNKNRLLSVLRF